MADTRPVGVFDSDLGGLTVLREILRQCPTEACVYVADGEAAPYGSKSNAFLLERSARITQFLLDQGAKGGYESSRTKVSFNTRVSSASVATGGGERPRQHVQNVARRHLLNARFVQRLDHLPALVQ